MVEQFKKGDIVVYIGDIYPGLTTNETFIVKYVDNIDPTVNLIGGQYLCLYLKYPKGNDKCIDSKDIGAWYPAFKEKKYLFTKIENFRNNKIDEILSTS